MLFLSFGNDHKNSLVLLLQLIAPILFQEFLSCFLITEIMTLKFQLWSMFVYLFVINLVSSLKYEHIGDCHFYGVSYTIRGLDNVTFICADHNNEDAIFLGSQTKCSNKQPEQNYWPGTVDFQNCRFPTMNRNYFEMFSNMHTFIISNVELEKMQMEIFREAKNVSTLDVSHNKLTEIPSLIFFNAVKVKYVDFSNNAIKHIGSMAFEGATKLQTLNLSNNQIELLDSSTFNRTNFISLDLSNNSLTKLPEHIFDPLVNLKRLNLSFNEIVLLDIKIFSYLIQLEYLNLKRNNLSDIKLGTFSQQHKLVSLDLSGNSLKTLNFKLFFPILQDLRSLHLGENQLKDLNGFRNALFPQLNSLDIQCNRFSCTYLAKFMESINWEKLHLRLDVNLINVHKSNIRGISCDDSEEPQPEDSDTLFKGLVTRQTIETNKDSNDDATTKISLIFICVALTVFLILFTVANLNQIYTQLLKYSMCYERFGRYSPKEDVVEFSNDGFSRHGD